VGLRRGFQVGKVIWFSVKLGGAWEGVLGG
jgi:hypothetical protein